MFYVRTDDRCGGGLHGGCCDAYGGQGGHGGGKDGKREERNVTRKRFVKLMMAMGFQRNEANLIALLAQVRR